MRSQCEDLVAAHLAQLCAWHEHTRGRGWIPGDYSFYVVGFEPAPGSRLSVQFWSEPGNRLLMEVCSTGTGPPAAAGATVAVREALAARGFEAGDEPGTFQKRLDTPDPAGVIGLAREALAVLTECLGYDGRQPLTYLFCLGRRDDNPDEAPARATATLRSVTVEDLEALLAAWALEAAETCWAAHRACRETRQAGRCPERDRRRHRPACSKALVRYRMTWQSEAFAAPFFEIFLRT